MGEEDPGDRRQQRAQDKDLKLAGGGVDAHRVGGRLAVVNRLQGAPDAGVDEVAQEQQQQQGQAAGDVVVLHPSGTLAGHRQSRHTASIRARR